METCMEICIETSKTILESKSGLEIVATLQIKNTDLFIYI